MLPMTPRQPKIRVDTSPSSWKKTSCFRWRNFVCCYFLLTFLCSTVTPTPTKRTTLAIGVAAAAEPIAKTSLRKKGPATPITKNKQKTKDEPLPPPPPPIATSSIPLHAHSGTHHAQIYIGSPPQTQILIVDTGSRFMAFPCENHCVGCGKHVSDMYYNPEKSTTKIWNACVTSDDGSGGGGGYGCKFEDHTLYKVTPTCENNKCRAQQKYTEGSSWIAYEIEDIVWFGTHNPIESLEIHMNLAVPYVFGCQIKETGLFKTQYADGIMGLAMFDTSLVKVSYEAGSIPRYAFSMCLTTIAGMLNLGGTALSYQPPPSLSNNDKIPKDDSSFNNEEATSYHLEPMRYTPLLKTSGLFTIRITAVYVGNVHITSNGKILSAFQSKRKPTIIDSGTTDIYLPKAIQEVFSDTWTFLTKIEYTNSLKSYTWKEYTSLPDITFILEGDVTWTIEPKYYMEGVLSKTTGEEWMAKDEQESKMLLNRIYLDEPDGVVLGSMAMMDHDVLFDVEGGRIGLTRAEC